MPKGLTAPREYTLEKLQELRREADIAGDTKSRHILSEMIVKKGGIVPSGVIPENETKIGRLERLRQDAIDVGDTTSAGLLTVRIAEEEVGIPTDYDPVDDVLQAKQLLLNAIETNESPETLAERTHQYKQEIKRDIWGEDVEEPEQPAAEPHTPHEGRNLTDGGLVGEMRAVAEDARGTVEAPTEPQDAPESDEERSEGDIATEPINNGTASVNATALIAKKGYLMEEIPARFGGKLDLTDVKHYMKILTAEV